MICDGSSAKFDMTASIVELASAEAINQKNVDIVSTAVELAAGEAKYIEGEVGPENFGNTGFVQYVF